MGPHRPSPKCQKALRSAQREKFSPGHGHEGVPADVVVSPTWFGSPRDLPSRSRLVGRTLEPEAVGASAAAPGEAAREGEARGAVGPRSSDRLPASCQPSDSKVGQLPIKRLVRLRSISRCWPRRHNRSVSSSSRLTFGMGSKLQGEAPVRLLARWRWLSKSSRWHPSQGRLRFPRDSSAFDCEFPWGPIVTRGCPRPPSRTPDKRPVPSATTASGWLAYALIAGPRSAILRRARYVRTASSADAV